MKIHLRSALCASVALVSVLISSAAYPQADGSVAEDDTALGDIVITAQRRAESVQDVPVAVSAYGGDDLRSRGIQNLEALSNSNPSLNVSLYQGEAQVYMRGIGTPIIVGGTDSSTAIHSDGVFLSRAAASVPAFFDVERVEIVRGPQGTLYGRNATGGSINVISRKPDDSFSAEARLLLGNYDRYQLFGAIGGPLSDTVRVRAAVQLNDRDGYTRVFRPDSDASGRRPFDRVEDANELYTRLSLEADLSENVKIQLIGDYYQARDNTVTWHVFDLGYSKNGFITNPAFVAATDAAAARGEYSELGTRTMFSDIDFFNKPDIYGISGRLDWSIGDYTVSSLTAYRYTNPFNRNDLDFSTANASDQVREERHKQFSQEIQLSSPTSGRFEYIVGAFYFRETNDIRNEYFLATVPDLLGFAPAPTCCLLLLNGDAETTALAVFTDGAFRFTDQLALRFGARYSREKRDGSNNVQLDRVPAFNNIFEFEAETFKAFTPKFGIEYKPNNDMLFYATAVRGFKSGGFNVGSYQNDEFDPEFIWSYELGAKTDLFDRRLRLNIVAFYYDYKDLQVQDTEQNNVLIRNAASAEIKGIEIEGVATPVENLTIDFSVAYLDAKFKKYNAPDPKYNNYLAALGIANPNAAACPAGTPNANLPNNPTCPFAQDLSGARLPKAPKWKLGIGVQYKVDLDSAGSLTLRGDYSWQSQIFFAAFQDREPVAGAPALAVLEQDSYHWLKGRVTYASADERWSVAAFIDNISNERVITNSIFTGDIVGSRVAGNLAPPRTFGVEAGIKF
jgi:iron complex outermembrane recepter protein